MTGVPFTFATATTAIPLSELDVCFATQITIGSSQVGLGNSANSLAGLVNIGMTGNFTYGGVTLLAATSGAGSLVAEEDGTWTPSDASGASLTFNTAQGFYRKVGKTVLVWGIVVFPVTASSSQAVIGSLPFTASNTSINGFPSVNIFSVGVTTGFVNQNATTFGFGANGAAVTNATMSGETAYFSGVYPTDS